MIVFIVPLKSVKMARSKTLYHKLLQRTLRSVTAQSSDQFRVIVICNELPQIDFRHHALEFLLVNLPLPERTEKCQNADKARRIIAGLEHAARYKPTHTMVVDADDCISNQIASFVKKHSGHPGWVLNSGFLYTEGNRIAFKNVQNFNHSCGSSVIIRYDLRKHLLHGNSYYGHEHPELPAPLQVTPLPFPGAVYNIRNGENFFMTKEKVHTQQRNEGKLRYYVKKMLKYRPVLVTPWFRQRFNLYRLSA